MKVTAALFLFAAIHSGGAPAQAAAPEPFHADYHASTAEAERTMADFSACVVANRRLRAQAERFLRLIPETPAFREAGLRIATPECMPRSFMRTQLRFHAGVFRETLYSALYQRDFGRSPPPDLTQAPVLAIAAEFDGDPTAIPATVTFERSVGDCVARADPTDVHHLLMTRISSDAEREALQLVVPQLAGCVRAGQRIAFSRSVLRGLLAEALYKLRQPAPASHAEGGAH